MHGPHDPPEDAAATESRPVGPSRGQVVALVLALCFLSGVIGWWIAQPDDESFNAVDVGFLSDMTTHHAGAISMSFDYLGRENDSLVGHFARDIVLTQAQEITVMNGLLREAGDPPAARDDVAMDWMGMPVPPGQMPGMLTDVEGEQLRSSSGPGADEIFTRLMIRHHAAGVAMGEYAAARGGNARVRRFAAAMARVQRVEINEMNNRRRVLGFPTVDPSALERLGGYGQHR
ncbi:MAG: DUF305 domain-containing protein [Acidimicrobiia bacterium]